MAELRFAGARAVVVLEGERFAGTPLDDEREIHCLGLEGRTAADALRAGRPLVDLFGRFLVLVHRVRDRVLEVHNDRWGAVPLYYAITEDAVYLAPRLRALVEAGVVRPELDTTALAEAMAFDVPLRDRTLLAGVHALEGGSSLTVELAGGRGIAVRRVWRPGEALRSADVPFARAKEPLLAAFLEGCAEATAGAPEVGITLSGGMDSRCLLAAAVHLGRPVHSYHMSEPGGRADAYARRMAASCGVAHAAYGAGPELAREYYRRLRHLVALHEGMSFEPELEVSWLRDRIPPTTVLLHGGYAELSKLGDLRRFYLNDRLRRMPVGSLAEALWPRWAGPLGIRLRAFAPDVREELARRARASFAERIAEIVDGEGARTAADAVQLCYLREQVKVEKYSGLMWNARLPTRFPFSHPRYVDLLLRVPAGDRLQQRFQIHLLRRLRPDLYRVPDANTGVRVDAPRALQLVVRGITKIRRDVLRSRAVHEHANVLGWLGAVEPPLAQAFAAGLDARLWDPRGFAGVLAEAGRDRRVGEAFQALLIFEAWREYMGLRGPLAA